MLTDPAPYRHFGEWRESECVRWNADDRENEDVFGIQQVDTIDDAIMRRLALIPLAFQILDEEAKTIQRLQHVIERKELDEL